MDPLLEDEKVVGRVLAGEKVWFEVLMRRHNQRLFRVARAIVKSDAEAEDVVQQAWLSAYAHLGQFESAARFSTWLTRIAINEALGRVQRGVRRAEVELEETEFMTARTPEVEVAGREEARLLEAAVDDLSEPYRLVFMLREVQELSVAETAESLGISEENVKVRLHRARAALREGLMARMESAARLSFPFLGARCDRIVAAVMAQL
jgi:RNA polymerase sigma-70 factor (ECF subfamily)